MSLTITFLEFIVLYPTTRLSIKNKQTFLNCVCVSVSSLFRHTSLNHANIIFHDKNTCKRYNEIIASVCADVYTHASSTSIYSPFNSYSVPLLKLPTLL